MLVLLLGTSLLATLGECLHNCQPKPVMKAGVSEVFFGCKFPQ